jgi:hypothetical protein
MHHFERAPKEPLDKNGSLALCHLRGSIFSIQTG